MHFPNPNPNPKHVVQVAAVDEPKLHLWETGVMRITRHPLALGSMRFPNPNPDPKHTVQVAAVDEPKLHLWETGVMPLAGAGKCAFPLPYPDPKRTVQVAAVDEPKLHLWETGVMRITRHPQALGQALWCAAHTAWIGSSFMAATSAALMAHHVFGCWHGDFRLRRKYGAVRTPRVLMSSASLVAGCCRSCGFPRRKPGFRSLIFA